MVLFIQFLIKHRYCARSWRCRHWPYVIVDLRWVYNWLMWTVKFIPSPCDTKHWTTDANKHRSERQKQPWQSSGLVLTLCVRRNWGTERESQVPMGLQRASRKIKNGCMCSSNIFLRMAKYDFSCNKKKKPLEVVLWWWISLSSFCNWVPVFLQTAQ